MVQKKVSAVVAYAPTQDQPGLRWRFDEEEIKLLREDIGPEELLVKMVATGICHTDIIMSQIPDGVLGVQYPKIFGHEGAVAKTAFIHSTT